MPFIPNTPESLLPRSDSRNPATTCKGLTSNGRPCRRGLASSPGTSPSSKPSQGVLAVLTEEDVDGGRAAAFFCWQHKDQAEQLAFTNNNNTEVVPLKERTSIDTLVDRLGVLDLDNETTATKGKKQRRGKREQRSTRRDTLPEQWHRMQGPLISVPEDLLPPHPKQYVRKTERPRPKSNVVPSMFCCLRPADDEDFPPPRRHSGHHARIGSTSHPPHMSQAPPRSQIRANGSIQSLANQHPNSHHTPVPQNSPRPASYPAPSSSSQTKTLLSLIPPHLSPQKTSALLTELAKPISSTDEAGYIYMFWLTPSSAPTPPSADIASSLLSPPESSSKSRHTSDVLRSNSTAKNGIQTILLKIGRASNVHRRLTQWTRQCSHNLTLIRYYPYQPTSPTPSPGPSLAPSPRGRQSLSPRLSDDEARKVLHVHRVERLIHIELADKRAKGLGKCDECGKEHREWFEVEATTQGLRDVDGCIRRWVGWAERQAKNGESKPQGSEGYF